MRWPEERIPVPSKKPEDCRMGEYIMALMGKKHRLFGESVEPACEYCELGSPNSEGNMILCPHKGIVAPYFRCRRFQYAPLKRVPRRRRRLPRFNPEDFEI